MLCPCHALCLRECRFLPEIPLLAEKIRTANRESPLGSRKITNLGRSLTGRREAADVNSHIPSRAPAVLCRGLEKSLAKRYGRNTAGARHGMCELALSFRLSLTYLNHTNVRKVIPCFTLFIMCQIAQ